MNWLRLLAVLVPLATGCKEGEQMTVEEVRSAIKEGIHRSELESFFQTKGITYSVLEGDELSLESDLAAEPDHLSARYVATIRDVGRWMVLYKESIVIKVDFDADGKATHVKVYKSRTGI